MVSSKRVISALGMFAGLGGATHGPGEILQGNVAPSDLYIMAWPSLTELSGEPAMTLIPNYMVEGVLTIIVGLIVAAWAWKYDQRKHGGLVLTALSLLLLLVGGGLVPPIIGMWAGMLGTIIPAHEGAGEPGRC